MKLLLLLLSSLLCTSAHAQRRAIMEGLPTSGNTLLVSTSPAQITIGAGSTGGTPISIISTGTYTPVTASSTNVSVAVPYVATYLRIGNIVMVTGSVDITPIAGANTVTTLNLSLPIASNMTAGTDLNGSSGVFGNQRACAVVADATNDKAQILFNSEVSIAVGFYYVYMYPVK